MPQLDEEEDEDEEGGSEEEKGRNAEKSKVYRPPKLAPMHYGEYESAAYVCVLECDAAECIHR